MSARDTRGTLDRWLAPVVPARRLAMVRVAVDLFACVWLVAMAPDLLARSRLPAARFDPTGIAGLVGVVSPGVILSAIVVVVVLGLCATAGRGHRVTGPAFALGLLWLLSYRNSWGHLSHVEHLMVLHVGIVGLSPAADAWRLGVARTQTPDAARYGWPLRLMSLVTVSTYAIAGLAKLRGGGMAWLTGETLQLHVAHEALRMSRVGASTHGLGAWLMPHAGVLSVLAVGTVVLEVGAPLALLRGRVRAVWVTGLWGMHAGIWAVMGIGFAYPLSGVAWSSLFEVERGLAWVRRRGRSEPREPG